MNRLLAAFAAIALLALPASGAIRATWTAATANSDPHSVQLNINRGSHHHFGRTFQVVELRGLTELQTASAAVVPVQFTLQRAAGTFAFEGTFKAGLGAGQLTFTANLPEADAIRALGIPFRLEDKSTDEEILFDLATVDVSSAYIRSIQGAGYPKEQLEQYVAMRIFRITPELVQEFRSLGFPDVSAEDLIASQVHRVTPAYVKEMRAAGHTNLSLDELVASRIHRATPEVVRDYAEAGYPNLDFDDLIAFRVHRVTPELIREYRQLGYDHLSPDDLVAMRIHRVTPEFIRELKSAGYSGVPVEKLVEMKIRHLAPRDLNR